MSLKKTLTLMIFLCLTTSAWAESWPKDPPRIGNLYLKQEYWGYMKEAATRYQISPYLIQAVCAIESRFDPEARSGRCYGLMQLHQDTARKYGVNSRNPRENIMGGAAVLAHLLQKYGGNIKKVLHVYNATCDASYEREVIKAYNQAQYMGASLCSLESKEKWRNLVCR